MNNNLKLLDWVTLFSYGIGIYALYISLMNLKENREQESELKSILDYLENHLQDQDLHLANQDKLISDLRGGGEK